MKQSNCYLYEYENNRQVRNVGFVKYILKDDKITFQIHGKGMNCSKDEKYEMYIFAGKSEACYVSRAGSVETEQSRINYMITVEGFTQEQFYNYDGIYLHVSGEKKYVAMWNKSAVCFDRVQSFDELASDQSRDEYRDCDDYCEEEYHYNSMECEDGHIHDEGCGYDDDCQEEAQEEINIHHEECHCEGGHSHEETCGEEIREHESHYHNREEYVLNDCLCEEEIEEVITGPCERDFQEEEERNSDITYEKIERHDIAKLPQREWKLANNSFLLHGYHNYQHVLFIQEAGRSFIGVPGIYAPREADAAKNFGFPVFHRVGRRDMQWDEGERDYNVDFGYWCREVTYYNRNR